jgi:hypothetical protein
LWQQRSLQEIVGSYTERCLEAKEAGVFFWERRAFREQYQGWDLREEGVRFRLYVKYEKERGMGKHV